MRALVIVALLGRVAVAGPWCGFDASFVPAGGSLPLHAWIVFAQDNNATARRNVEADEHRSHRTFDVTLDGKPVTHHVDSVTDGKWLLRTIEVNARRPGKLVIDVQGGRGHLAEYQLDPAWVAPDKVVATIGRYRISYHPNAMAPTKTEIEGVALGVDTPVTMFRVSWRRDERDPWHAFFAPAELRHDTATLMLGGIECTSDNIPVELLRRGVHVAIKARLPDNHWVAVGGVPDPLVLPAEPAGAAVEDAGD